MIHQLQNSHEDISCSSLFNKLFIAIITRTNPKLQTQQLLFPLVLLMQVKVFGGNCTKVAILKVLRGMQPVVPGALGHCHWDLPWALEPPPGQGMGHWDPSWALELSSHTGDRALLEGPTPGPGVILWGRAWGEAAGTNPEPWSHFTCWVRTDMATPHTPTTTSTAPTPAAPCWQHPGGDTWGPATGTQHGHCKDPKKLNPNVQKGELQSS